MYLLPMPSALINNGRAFIKQLFFVLIQYRQRLILKSSKIFFGQLVCIIFCNFHDNKDFLACLLTNKNISRQKKLYVTSSLSISAISITRLLLANKPVRDNSRYFNSMIDGIKELLIKKSQKRTSTGHDQLLCTTVELP